MKILKVIELLRSKYKCNITKTKYSYWLITI